MAYTTMYVVVVLVGIWVGLDGLYITDNITTFHGSYDMLKPSVPSVFSSIGFPNYYIQDSERYRYHIQTDFGRIKLSFDDWSLAPTSQVIIYPTGPSVNVDRIIGTSLTNRPLVYSTYSNIDIEFQTGVPWSPFDANNRPYFGFTARYEFIIDVEQRANLPYTDGLAKYYYSQLGGTLLSVCTRNTDHVDSLWVVPRTQYAAGYTQLSLRLDDTSICISPTIFGSNLNIRTGKTSQSAPLMVFTEEAKAGLRFTTSDGFYVRLQCPTQCNKMNMFSAVFVWNTPAISSESSPGGFCEKSSDFLCRKDQVCISWSLRCDGVNHCSRGEDETDCDTWLRVQPATPQPTNPPAQPDVEPVPCESLSYVNCADGRGMFCNTERCDGRRQCSDGSDETRCYHRDFTIWPRNRFHDKKKYQQHDCPRRYRYLMCKTGSLQQYCSSKYCDGKPDCADGSDEANCNKANQTAYPLINTRPSPAGDHPPKRNADVTVAIVLPVVLVSGILIVVTCIIISFHMRSRRRLISRARERLAYLRQVAGHTPPPPYNETNAIVARAQERLAFHRQAAGHTPPPPYHAAPNTQVTADASEVLATGELQSPPAYNLDAKAPAKLPPMYVALPPPYSARVVELLPDDSMDGSDSESTPADSSMLPYSPTRESSTEPLVDENSESSMEPLLDE